MFPRPASSGCLLVCNHNSPFRATFLRKGFGLCVRRSYDVVVKYLHVLSSNLLGLIRDQASFLD